MWMRKHAYPDAIPSICFVALNAYNVLSGQNGIQHIGGAEVQQVRIASWLAQRGYPVSFITLDHGQPDGIDLGGIRVFKAYAKDTGIRCLRYFHPRWSGLCRAMTRADAGIYYQRGPECETGQVGLWCRLHGRRFIFGAANAVNCNQHLLSGESWRDRYLYRVGVRQADVIIAQTEQQQQQFRENMGRSSVLVRSCGWNLVDSPSARMSPPSSEATMRVVWVGRISPVKRFEWLLDAAERCPDMVFDVVGAANAESGYASSLIARAAATANVRMHGRIPHSEMPDYYRRCSVLCCTSAYEGFPNTFLEAWSLGIPVVSTFDPDGLIASKGLGLVARDVQEIVASLRQMSRSAELWTMASTSAVAHFRDHHTPEVCLPQFERVLLDLARRGDIGESSQASRTESLT